MSSTSKSSTRRWPQIGCVSLVALLALLSLCGGAAYLLAGQYARPQLGPQVTIELPSDGQLAELNAPLAVHATASALSGLTRLEVYADGALVAAQASGTPSGDSPLVLNQNWSPVTTGRHVLLARTYLPDGTHADSALVTVDVTALVSQTSGLLVSPAPNGQTPSLNDLAQMTGHTPAALQQLNPALASTDLGAPLAPGTPIILPRSPAPTPAPTTPPAPLPNTPSAPSNLTISVDCTTRQLHWADNSNNETGFVVYRLDMGAMTPIATLPANATRYTDSASGYGTFQYEVAAANGGLEGLSLIVAATVPGSCLPPATAPTVVLSIVELDTSAPWDGVFCYFNVNGAGFQRAPAGDFAEFTPNADGLTYDLARQLPNHGQFTLAVSPSGSVTLAAECWGRHTDEVLQIAPRLTATHPSSDWDGHDLIQIASWLPAKVLAQRVRQAPAQVPHLRLTYRLGSDTPDTRHRLLPDIPSDIDLSPHIPVLEGGAILPPPYNLRIQNGLDACWMEGDARAQGLCVLGGLFVGGWPSLYWDWTGNSTYPASSLGGFWITGTATDLRSGTQVAIVFPSRFLPVAPGHHSILVPVVPFCGQRITFQAQALALNGMRSISSDSVYYDAPACAGTVHYSVEFNAFRVARLPASGDWHNGEIEDVNGDACFLCTDRRLELWGYIWVNHNGLETSGYGGDIVNRCPRAAWCVERGDYILTDMPLFPVTAWSAEPSGFEQNIDFPPPLSHSCGQLCLNRNVIRFDQGLADGLTISWAIDEIDQGQTTGTAVSGTVASWCAGSMTFPAPITQSAIITNGQYVLLRPANWADPGPEGTCAISAFIRHTFTP